MKKKKKLLLKQFKMWRKNLNRERIINKFIYMKENKVLNIILKHILYTRFIFYMMLKFNLFIKKKFIKIFGFNMIYKIKKYRNRLLILRKIYKNKFKNYIKKFYLLALKKKQKNKNIFLYKKKKLLLYNKRVLFREKLLKNRKRFLLFFMYLKYRYKRLTKKQFMFIRNIKRNKINFLKIRLAKSLLFKLDKRKKKNEKEENKINLNKKDYYRKKIFELQRQFRLKKFRLKFKKNLKLTLEQKYILLIEHKKKLYTLLASKSIRFLKNLLKKRKKRFLQKLALIRKFKRLNLKKKVNRRKKRKGILHFRVYYSNYYVTLTDLSHNVIISCSAGSVRNSKSKKVKMSHVVNMPIFFRILFFLKAYKIRNLKFVFRHRMDKMCFGALYFFKKRGYKILSFSYVRRAAHHLGQRTQKPRRI